MVREAFLKQSKRVAIPFAVITTASFFTLTNQAKAATAAIPFFFKPDTGLFEKLNLIADKFLGALDWIKQLDVEVGNLSAALLVKIYELLLLVLQVPLFIFNNTYIKDASLVFSGISILLVTILTMVEGIKKMMKKRHTEDKKIYKRFFVATVGAGFAPLLFEKAFWLINQLTVSITKIGGSSAQIEATKGVHLESADWFNIVALLGFDVMLIALVVPIILQNGRRFFDLMCLASITPLALSAWIFNDHRHMFDKWWFNIKKLSMTPLVYALFICFLGLFIFGTRNVVSGGGLLIKLIIVIGGLMRMANPPTFVKARLDNGENVDDSLWNMVRTVKNAYDTVTLKKVRSVQLIKGKKQDKLKKIADLKKKHNRRYVGDLLKKK